jgi:hypothetical protein
MNERIDAALKAAGVDPAAATVTERILTQRVILDMDRKGSSSTRRHVPSKISYALTSTVMDVDGWGNTPPQQIDSFLIATAVM